MDNIELVDIYKILLNMQSDIHRLDKKTDALSQELKDTKVELTQEFDKKLEKTKRELQLTFNHEKRIRNLEEFAKTKGYTMVSDSENNYNCE